MGVLVVVVLVLIPIVGWTLSFLARQQSDFLSPYSPAECERLLQPSFPKLLWKDVAGEGRVNKHRRAVNNNHFVVSINLNPNPGGGTQVSVWLATYAHKGGFVYGASTVVRKKFMLQRRLTAEQANTTSATS